uniref:photosystem I assembly factor I n=1 Tax=Botrychium ternatum TaxID=208695 RepID=UPI001EDF5B28|nr:photosystem I assembly factor I [Botrychium ternatum]UHY94418.1 photosystem I assembly factor I [Botrychium ternatum]
MPRSQRNDNSIDKTFTIVADILLRIIPTTQGEKEASIYYRDGAIWMVKSINLILSRLRMSAQSEGEYAEASQNYYKAMRLEIDPYDRSYTLYNIGPIHTSNGEHAKASEYHSQALERNPSLPQAFNNMAVICHYVRLSILWNLPVQYHREERLSTHAPSRDGTVLTSRGERGEQAIQQGDPETSEAWFDQAAEYWGQAIALAPSNYIEAQNRLRITGRSKE